MTIGSLPTVDNVLFLERVLRRLVVVLADVADHVAGEEGRIASNGRRRTLEVGHRRHHVKVDPVGELVDLFEPQMQREREKNVNQH